MGRATGPVLLLPPPVSTVRLARYAPNSFCPTCPWRSILHRVETRSPRGIGGKHEPRIALARSRNRVVGLYDVSPSNGSHYQPRRPTKLAALRLSGVRSMNRCRYRLEAGGDESAQHRRCAGSHRRPSEHAVRLRLGNERRASADVDRVFDQGCRPLPGSIPRWAHANMSVTFAAAVTDASIWPTVSRSPEQTEAEYDKRVMRVVFKSN